MAAVLRDWLSNQLDRRSDSRSHSNCSTPSHISIYRPWRRQESGSDCFAENIMSKAPIMVLRHSNDFHPFGAILL